MQISSISKEHTIFIDEKFYINLMVTKQKSGGKMQNKKGRNEEVIIENYQLEKVD